MMQTGPAGNRFADYFVVSGLDVESGLEPDQLSGDNLHCPPLGRPYKCKVLAHYPEQVPWNPFDQAAVGMLCHPKGLSFRTQKQSRESQFHSFIITREDGSRTYGAAYTFYEKVSNTQICAAMKTLHAMHYAELSNNQSHTLYSHLGPVYQRSPEPNRRKPPTKEDNDIYDHTDTLFATKSICLLCQLPLIQPCRKFLKSIYKAVCVDQGEFSLESYIYNILYEVPCPPPGRSLKFYTPGNRAIICQRPGLNELPLFDFSLKDLFVKLGVENVVQLITSALLEHQILIYSKDYQQLMMVAESISVLLFPFNWQHVYVPILPASMLHFLDAPVPFIMGLHSSSDHSELELPSQANMCFVDIDNSIVEFPEDLPQFPHKGDLMGELRVVLQRYQIPPEPSHNSLDQSSGDSNDDCFNLSNSGSKDSLGYSKKDSGCFENDSGMSSNEESASSSVSSIPNKMDILQQSEALARIAAIAKKTGVMSSSLEEITSKLTGSAHNSPKTQKREKNVEKEQKEMPEQSCLSEHELRDLLFNSEIREVFLNRFLHLFSMYEHFVIQPSQDMESWLNNREIMQNFDKAAFLGDQPDTYLPFLSPFIETQMFACLIDSKILAQWEEPDYSLRVFDNRLRAFKERFGENRSPTYEKCFTFRESESIIQKRASVVDHEALPPHSLEGLEGKKHKREEFPVFPILNSRVLNRGPEPARSSKRRENAKWRRKDRIYQHSEHIQLNSDQREKYIQEARSKSSVRQPKLSDISPSAIAQTNWKFVETLLKECKVKTKRMLVEKMGQEAVDLGHGEVTLTGVEENTLIASLCDLLERIWSHGLQSKQGKSALWSHLQSFQEVEQCEDSSKPIDPNFLTPGEKSRLVPPEQKSGPLSPLYSSGNVYMRFMAFYISSLAIDTESPKQTRHRRTGSAGGLNVPTLTPLPQSVSVDMKKIQKMPEIKTHVGYARAWVRLALERKMLSRYIKELLSDNELLRALYKRYAFLRCEDEREQFLYHLLSLNAVDYFCFTNTYTKAVIPYKMLIFPARKLGGSSTSANVWFSIAGQLGETRPIQLGKNAVEMEFEHKNLGVLSTLRIGHDNSGMSPRWCIEHILVRNEITGHTFKFPCGRWLGRGVDDGSIERLLVGELVPHTMDNEELVMNCRTPPRNKSPSTPRRSSESRMGVPQIQEMLGEAVNNIVKYYYKPEKERGSLTYLLCGDYGLVFCMESVFQYGFRSSRLFRSKIYVWDYIEKVQQYFEQVLSDREGHRGNLSERALCAMRTFIHVTQKVNSSSQDIGKDGKFQLLICVGARDHLLSHWVKALADNPVTQAMYEERSFLREQSLVIFLIQILNSLRDFTITLETSLTKGLDV